MDVGEKKEYRMKFICCGCPNAGKTSIIKRLVNDIFLPSYKATVGVDFALKVVDVSENLRVHLQLWDIAGQETFGSMTKIYYKNAVGAIIVFDLTDPSSFESVDRWKLDIQEHLPDSDMPILLLGNKYDLVVDSPDRLATPLEMIEAYAQEQNLFAFHLVSAKSSYNIKEPIMSLLDRALEVVRLQSNRPDPTIIDLVGNNQNQTEGETDCC